MHSTTAKTLIEQLALARHPEGGWFKETYRASDKLAAQPFSRSAPRARSCRLLRPTDRE